VGLESKLQGLLSARRSVALAVPNGLWAAPGDERLVISLDPQITKALFLARRGVAEGPVFFLEIVEETMLLEQRHYIAAT